MKKIKVNNFKFNVRGTFPIGTLLENAPRTNIAYLLLIIPLFILFTNCQEPNEACLDIRATNFDATATKECKNCCTYPNLQLQVSHLADTNNFRENLKIKLNNDSISIIQIQFYLSDFQLFTKDNSKVTVFDSIQLFRQNDTIRVPSNYALVGKSNGFDYKIGQFNSVGEYTKVTFKVGLDDKASSAIPTKMPASSPLSIRPDSMYLPVEKKYIFNKIVYAKGQGFKDTVRLFIMDSGDITINNVKNLSFKNGFDAVIQLKINYLRFFDGVIVSETENTIKGKIVNNYSKVFSIN